ncbi:MAG: alpha/beta hydrolase [Alphaproteobacteria bacterium]|nr:MAG: alpha/beta hydrolase [Alphaproteobacteria bacterium]
MTTEITHNTAKVGDVTLHYVETGAGRDDTLLLLHGYPEFWYCWKDQLPVLGREFHTVAPDMRGYNLSDKPDGIKAYKIRHLIADVIGLADHLGKDEFYLAAHDWGAAIAWAVAIAHPDRIKGLVILNGPHPYIFAELLARDAEQIEHSQYMAYFQNEGIEEKMLADNCRRIMDWTFAKHVESGVLSEEDADAYRTAWRKPGALKSMLNYYRASPLVPAEKADPDGPGSGLDPENFRVHVPTRVVWGEEDHALTKKNLIGLEKLVPDLEIVTVPGVTHWITHEAPDRVNSEISGFIKKLKARAA